MQKVMNYEESPKSYIYPQDAYEILLKRLETVDPSDLLPVVLAINELFGVSDTTYENCFEIEGDMDTVPMNENNDKRHWKPV